MSHSDLFDDDITLVESLLNKFLQDPNLRHLIDKRQDKSPFCSPLEFACKNHRWDIAKLLAPHCSQSQRKEEAPSALHFTVLSLIKHSNSTTISGSAKEVALIKLTDLLRLLLQGKGIDVNATCNLQKSLIEGLATTGGAFKFHVKVFEYVTALHLAALFGCDIAVDELLKVESIDTNIKTDSSGGSIYGLNAAYVLAKQGFDLSEINFILDKKRKYDYIRERLGNFKSTQSSTSSASGPTMAPMFTATASSSSSTDDSKEGEDEHYQNDLLRKLFELHWDDKFAEEGPYSDMSKQDALIQFIQSYPRNPSGWSVLANALPLNDSLNIRSEKFNGKSIITLNGKSETYSVLDLCKRSLDLCDNNDIFALKVILRMLCLDPNSSIDMPHNSGKATALEIGFDIYLIENEKSFKQGKRKAASSNRHYSKDATAARKVATEAAARKEALRKEKEKEAAAAAAAAASKKESASSGGHSHHESSSARGGRDSNHSHHEPSHGGVGVGGDSADRREFNFLVKCLKFGGKFLASKESVYITSLLNETPSDNPDSPSPSILASLRFSQKEPMKEILKELRVQVKLAPKVDGKKATELQSKMYKLLQSQEQGNKESSVSELFNIPNDLRPFLALLHIISDYDRGSFFDDASLLLLEYNHEIPSDPSPIAILANALLLRQVGIKENDDEKKTAGGNLLCAFSHWGGGFDPDPDGTSIGSKAEHWLSDDLKTSSARSSYRKLYSKLNGGNAASGFNANDNSSDPDEGGRDDSPESEWERQKSLPGYSTLPCKALDKIMKDFDGLRSVKQSLLNFYILVKQAKERASLCGTDIYEQGVGDRLNFVFMGAPGTGKTTMAENVHDMLQELKIKCRDAKKNPIDRNGKFILVDNGGQLDVAKLEEKAKESLYGTLFIDEAYQLADPFVGKKVMDELLTLAENKRTERSVILSGYKEEMENMINGGNSGFASRFPQDLHIMFEDITQPIVLKLLKRFMANAKLTISNPKDEVGLKALSFRIAKGNGKVGFANVRTVKNQWMEVLKRLSTRVELAIRDDKSLNNSKDFKSSLICTDFIGLPPDPEKDPMFQKLNTMIGFRAAKAELKKIAVQLFANYRDECHDVTPKPFSLNCIFAGNAGTGKTTMGKMFAEFLVRCGLASGITIVTPAQFMSESSSETRDNLKGVLKAAALSGRVLFIDEAHTMFEVDGRNNGGGVPPLRDGSKTAFETIVSAIPGDGSSSFILILGGYTKELRDMLAHPNIDQGFARRVPNWVPFDDFDNEELRLLLKSTASDPRFNLHVDFPTVDMVVKHKLVGLRAKKGWGNAGSIVNIITDAAKEQQNRILESERRGDLYSPDDSTEKKKWKSSQLLLIDFGINMEMVTASNKEKVAQALKGLSNTAYFEGKFEEISESPSLTNPMKKPNFVFVGPPGTGKSNISRRFGSFLNMLGIITSDTVHEITGLELLGQYLGQTVPKVNAAFEAAKGGILFIDEAYAIYPSDTYKKEAVDQIVANMTKPEYMTSVVIILAGYEYEIEKLLGSNRGLRSRFTEKLEFKSWGVPESVSYILSQLALKKKQPTEEAKAAIVSLVEDYIDSQGEKWGSARDCITVCSKIDDNEELRWRDFTKGYSKRLDNAKKVPGMKFSKEEFEEKESELEKAFYVKAEAEEGTEAEEGEGTASQEAKVTSMVRVIREEDIVKARIIIPISSKDTDVDDSSSAGSGGGNGGGGRAAHAIDIAQVVSDPNPQQKKKQKVKPKDDQNTEKDDKKENNSISLLDAVFAFDKFLDLSSYEGDLPEEVLRLLQIKENEREKRDEAKRQFEELKRKAREESERKKKAREEAEELRKKIEEEKKRLAELAEQVRLAELAKEAARLAELKRQQAEREIAHKLLLKQQEEAREEARKQAKIRTMGLCIAGFEWKKVFGGYQCEGGSHYISDQDLN